ncbi:MAG: hypothetical protein A3F54_01950 [Candidatus Kerfeldbacteria bacterium RIFCSPHIGHO2_12_FULL_48_17]|uniref:Uncharacterized protein n=1 Tax=Candidatus Kerfeldbacteria bacterium RIFCSPHIGHO2_12_FULL_48_17 TaxID=1798542 RepID=A0A1G2AXH4_9BACT|nr:MAG: hypothetical protein A3F54_01950 [Candidatus Kerfeldbacteria bacterium RIFCSPHIGHO2_12_FULL_48_17]
MNNSSHSFRWFLAVIFALTFFAVALTGIPFAVAVHNGTSEDTIKQWLNESGIYTSALDAALAALPDSIGGDKNTADTEGTDGEEALSDNTGDGEEGDVAPADETDPGANDPLNNILAALRDHNSAVYKEVAAIITPTFLQTSVENVLHGMYTWFRGEAAEPKFEVVLIHDDATLLRILNVGMTEQLAQLPACDSTGGNGTADDPFAAGCLPPDFDMATYAQTFLDDFSTTATFHTLRESMRFSSDQLHLDPAILTLVPQQFSLLRMTPWMLAVILLVGLFLTVLITPGWKHGLVVGGVAAFVTGGVLMAEAALVRMRVPNLFTGLSSALHIQPEATDSFYAALYPLFHAVISDSMGMILWWAMGLAALGVVLLVVGMFVPAPVSAPAPKAAQKK